MSSRLACAALLFLATAATAATAAAQGAPPAAGQGAPQGAPRHTSTTTLGGTTLTVEHGQPPWSDQRLGQLAQIAQQGGTWRLGSEGITILEVKGDPVFFGDELVMPGRYGLNLAMTGESNYSFILFAPLHPESPQLMGDEPRQMIPGEFVGNATEIVPAMALDFASTGAIGSLTLAWGPLRLVAPIAAAGVTTAEIELNGNPAKTTWYRRALPATADCTKPMVAGKIDFEIDGNDCGMNVYVMLEGDQLVAVMRNREREAAEAQNASLEEGMKRFDAMIQQFGQQAEAQIGAMKKQAQRQQVKNELTLEETAGFPDNLKFSAPFEEGKPGELSCEVFQTRRSINLEVSLGGKKGVVRIDENVFALKGES